MPPCRLPAVMPRAGSCTDPNFVELLAASANFARDVQRHKCSALKIGLALWGCCIPAAHISTLKYYGWNDAIVFTESLARIVAVSQITHIRGWSHRPPQSTEVGPHRLRVCCAAIGTAQWAFIRATAVSLRSAEWLARLDCTHSLVIGDVARLRSPPDGNCTQPHK